MAAGAVVHEIARAALQGLDIVDVRAGVERRDFVFLRKAKPAGSASAAMISKRFRTPFMAP